MSISASTPGRPRRLLLTSESRGLHCTQVFVSMGRGSTSQELQVSWSAHLRGPGLLTPPRSSSKRSRNVASSWQHSGRTNILHLWCVMSTLHHRQCPDKWMHSVVWHLCHRGEETAAEGHQYSSEGCWLPTSMQGQDLLEPSAPKGHKILNDHIHPGHILFTSLCSGRLRGMN